MDAIAAGFVYDDSYPQLRAHFDPLVGKHKVSTLWYWLKLNDITPEALTICEVGFGAGFCLAALRGLSKRVFGVEAVRQNIEHATRLGLARESLYHMERLPPLLPEPVDFWIFQDSFEHLDDPQRFLKWMISNSSSHSRILVVAPKGGGLSQKLLGRWWPHKMNDHRFHWTESGLRDFFSRNGFVMERSFLPLKYVSPGMLITHVLLKTGWRRQNPPRRWRRFFEYSILFNIGEMGLIFRRDSS